MLEFEVDRRNFIQKSVSTVGSLCIGILLPGPWEITIAGEVRKGFSPNAWIKIPAEGPITFILDKAEMGQNVYTSLPVILCEELELDPSKVQVDLAPVDSIYNHPEYGMQLTGGSSSIRTGWLPLKMAGATAREMLIQAAAIGWKVAKSECFAEDGFVYSRDRSKSASYQSLAKKAADLPIPEVSLKDPRQYKYIGKNRTRFDALQKTTGAGQFGIDALPDIEAVAGIIHCPTIGGKAKSIDSALAAEVPGFIGAFPVSSGVGIVCEKFWQVLKAVPLIQVDWSPGNLEHIDDAAINKILQEGLKAKGRTVENEGDADGTIAQASNKIESEYKFPYLAHAAMEPINCSVIFKNGECHVWTPTQSPTTVRHIAIRASGLPAGKVFVHTLLAGGGFGRKSYAHDTYDAVQLAQKTGKSVKVIWTRENDTKAGPFRPASHHKLAAAFDAKGKLLAWQHKIASPSILAQALPTLAAVILPEFIPGVVKEFGANLAGSVVKAIGNDDSAVEGAKDLLYRIPHKMLSYTLSDPKIPVHFWRSVGHSFNGFVSECFMDEICHHAKQDPVGYRRELLGDRPRALAVLNLAAEKAGWGKPLPAKSFHGVAVNKSFGTYVAQIAEIQIGKDIKSLKVLRVTCAVDCGQVVDPDTVKAQMEGAIIFGLSAALYGKINFVNGGGKQSNFHDYQVVRMDVAPEINVHIVPSTATPQGVGEPGLPPIAPAVANAIFAATGNRIRELPIFT
jgi:CO/xanthine dehydrogenase Mo-binding subunit